MGRFVGRLFGSVDIPAALGIPVAVTVQEQ